MKKAIVYGLLAVAAIATLTFGAILITASTETPAKVGAFGTVASLGLLLIGLHARDLVDGAS